MFFCLIPIFLRQTRDIAVVLLAYGTPFVEKLETLLLAIVTIRTVRCKKRQSGNLKFFLNF
jgi:hypothetical protein